MERHLADDPDIALWRQADQAFDQLLDVPAAEREAVLAAMALPDAVRERVQRLVEAIHTDPLARCPTLPGRRALQGPLLSGLEGRQAGRWRLLEEIGRGGMSVVYVACDIARPEHRVALKLLASASLASGMDRLAREQHALARLNHPHIVPLIDAGLMDGVGPWLAMGLVEGERIDHWCERQGLDTPARVRLMVDVADAVAHAHRALIVHRDLKPGNVMVDAEGRVRLLDFGIAGLLLPGAEKTGTLAMALTPEYAAPEQFSGAPASTSMDVYGLGALLWRLLVGQPPPRADREAPTLRASQALGLAKSGKGTLRTRRDALRGDLDAILGTALHAEPAQRYEGAAQFAADLRNWLDGRPVQARRPSLGYRLRKLVRRHRGTAIALATALLALLIGLSASLWQASRADRAAAQAREQAALAQRESARAEAVSRFLVDLFGAAAAGRPQSERPGVDELLAIASQRAGLEFESEPETRARLLLALGQAQTSVGAVEEGKRLLDQALQELPATAPAALRVGLLAERARAAFRVGEFEAALDFIATALPQLEAQQAPSHELLESLRDVQVNALLNLGRSDEALTEARAHLQRLLAKSDVPAHLLAGAEYTLAIVLNQREEGSEASALLGQARARMEGVEGHWELRLSILNSLASALALGQRYREAAEMRTQALSLVEAGYPPEHVRIGQTLNNLGSDLNRLGRIEEGLEHIDRAIPMLRAGLGEQHPSVAAAHNNRARALVDLGRQRDALFAFAEAQAILARIAPPDDRRRLVMLLNEVDALTQLGDLVGAEERLRVFDAATAQPPPLQAAIRALFGARQQRLAGRPHAAAEQAASAVAQCTALFSGGSSLLAFAHLEWAHALWQLGRTQEALQQMASGAEALERLGADFDATALRVVGERGMFWRAIGEPLRGRREREDFLQKLGELWGPDDPRLRRLAQAP